MFSFEEYKSYITRFNRVEQYLRSKSAPADVVAYNICKLREYYPERMSSILKSAGFMFIENPSDFSVLESESHDLGLFSSNGNFLLEGRFIFPVKDMLGNTVALIGWFPDSKRYITTPSRLFSKGCLFYGLEQLGKTGIGKKYFLSEGIFDSLSLRSIGFNAVSEMGIISTRVKESLYPLFGEIVGISDNDSEGRNVIEQDKWHLPSNSSYIRIIGDAKDIDDVVNMYEFDDIRSELVKISSTGGRIRKLIL